MYSTKLNEVTNLFIREDKIYGHKFIISERIEGESIELDERSARELYKALEDFFVPLELE